MKNPLDQFITVEEREDGMYVKLNRSERDSLQLDVILKTMASSTVMNFDAGLFKDVFTRARGGFEKIGPVFECYDEELDSILSVNMSSQKASIKIPETVRTKGKVLNERLLMFFLRRKGIICGIDMGKLAQVANGLVFDQYVDIAFSVQPVSGVDAQIEMKVSISPELKPKMRSDGSVDFRNIQTFVSVTKGDVLAVKIPAGAGTPGMSVTGIPVAAQPGKDIKLPCGRNTEVSSDGLRLIALATGTIFIENGLLHIAELLHIDSDVDFSVGNIKYAGDVLINGSIKPGFVVEADGSIQVKGSVESARVISRTGSVIVDKGIMGKGDTFITAKTGITVPFAQDTTFSTEGTFTLEKYLLHCTISCGKFEGNGPQCGIIGGEIRASQTITVRNCGSENDVPTKIVVYDKNKHIINGKIKELAELHEKLVAEMLPVEKQLKTKAALFKKAGDGVSDRHRDEIKKWVDAYNEIKKKINFVDVKMKELTLTKDKISDMNGFISILDRCYPGVEINLYDAPYIVKNIMTGKRFIMKNNSIFIEG